MAGEHLGDDWTSAHAATVPKVSHLPGLFPLHLAVLLSGLFPLHLTVLLPHLASATVGLQRRACWACFGWVDWTVAGMSKQSLTHHPGLEPEQYRQALSAVLVMQTTQGDGRAGTKGRCKGQMRRADAKGSCERQMLKDGIGCVLSILMSHSSRLMSAAQ